jgi:hypothetical protein
MSVRGESEFLHLPFQDKLDFLYGLPARYKRDLILSAPEAEQLVRSFAPETLFYTLKEIGSADAGDLLGLAAPEQVKGLFDLDCWNKDQVNFARMREWIEAMAEGGRRRLAEAMMELDLELVALLMRRYLRVHRLDETRTEFDLPSEQVVRFDEQYAVEFIRHDNILALLQEFLEEAFERDYDYFSNLLDEVYWGIDAELEEQAYQFRRARLNDRGFPDFFEAQRVFAYINPAQFERLRHDYSPPDREGETMEADALDTAMVAPGAADGSLFNAALTAGFAAQGKRQIRTEIALVANQVLVARNIDFGDAEAVRLAVESTHHYLNLGLEHVAGGDLRTAIDYLRDTHLHLLFRLGLSLTIDLRKRAEALLRTLGLTPGKITSVPYLDSPYREALEGFLRPAPLYFSGLDGEGAVVLRDFREMRDLHTAHGVLEQLEQLPALFLRLLGIDLAAVDFRAQTAGRDIRLSQLLLTALVNQVLEGRLSPQPIAAARLGIARNRIMTGEQPARLAPAFRALVNDSVAARLDSAVARQSAPYINSCLSLLEDELTELPAHTQPDPRFIQTLLLRQD